MTEQRSLEEIYARTGAYLVAQGDKYSFAELWPRVVRARLDLLDALDGVSEAQSAFSPAEGEWSIREIVAHALASSRAARAAVEALVRGDASSAALSAAAVMAGHVEPDRPLEALRSALVADGLEWSVAIAALPERPPLEPVATHGMFGALHARAWHLFQRIHDQDHTSHIGQVKAAAGYPAE